MTTIQEKLQQGWQKQQQGNVSYAEECYRQVIQQDPTVAEAHVYLGIVLFDQRRFSESESAYREGLRLADPFPIAWNNLGNTLRMLNRIDEAEACFQRALEQKPGYLNALKNRGTLWVWAGEVERGLRWYEQAMKISPEDPELHRNRGILYLLQGRYQEGWPEYRWRWKMPGFERPPVEAPCWMGEPVDGQTLLLYPEQGLGDTIHFIRMAKILKQQGARTLLRCSAKWIPLLATAKGMDAIVPEGLPLEHIDYHASVIEVADRLQIDPNTLPPQMPYLAVEESLKAYWRNRLSSISGKRIGICWQGNPQYHADHYRSVSLSQFAPITKVGGVSLVSLQFGYGSEQCDLVPFGPSLIKLPADIDQSGGMFMDTAAILCNLDLVITIDGSTAHLAGALGVPTWLVLGKVPDWRWLTEGTTTPWYPSVRLFRQKTVGHWEDVFQDIAAALKTEMLDNSR